MEPLTIKPDRDEGGEKQLVINDHRVSADWTMDGGPLLSVRFFDSDVVALLAPYSLKDLRKDLTCFSAPYGSGGGPLRCRLVVGEWAWHQATILQFIYSINPRTWTALWTLFDLSAAVQKSCEEHSTTGLEFIGIDSVDDGFVFNAYVRTENNSFGEEVEYWQRSIRFLIADAQAHLTASMTAGSLTKYFNFPSAVQAAAEQYLIYFGQFLADLGIDADVDLKHEASHVLFSVTPQEGEEDREEVLARIRDALDAYLRLPHDPSFAMVASHEQDIAVRHLEAQIQFLHSQLTMATATLQMQGATIEALHLSNFRYREMLPGATEGGDTEVIIPGVMSVKEVEKGGLVFHIPEILRKLKRHFGGRAEG